MNPTKTLHIPIVGNRAKPGDYRNVFSGEGVCAFEDLDFRICVQLPGNYLVVKRLMSEINRQASKNETIFGPFVIVGNSQSGKEALLAALPCPSYQSRLLLEYDLSTCTQSHEVARLIGAPPGYGGYENVPAFVETIKAINNEIFEYAGEAEDMPLPVVIFRNADECHPDVLSALTRFITTGFLKTNMGTELQLGRGVFILTLGRNGRAGQAFCDRLDDCSGDLRKFASRITRDGSPVFKDELLEAATFIPIFEPAPGELITYFSTLFGRDIALACGLPSAQTSRVRAGSTIVQTVWSAADILGSDGAKQIIDKVRNAWDQISKETCRKIAAKWKGTVAIPPEPRHVYVAYFDESNKAWGIAHVTGDQLKETGVVAEIPLPYLGRTTTGNIRRSDYWKLPADFDAKLGGIVVGQGSTIAAVGGRMRARIAEQGTAPMLSFIAVGPTGSGKTLLGNAIADVTGHPKILCECARWKTEEQVAEGIFGEGSESVASKLADNPAAVVIFDEVDKAHQKMWEYFLSAGDTGMLIDSTTGREVSLRYAIVEFTSNYLSDRLAGFASQAAEKTVEEMDVLLREVLRQCANIHEACLERFDFAFLMLAVDGEKSYPMWRKMLQEKLARLGTPVALIAESIPAYLENLHLDKGGAPGGRARRRTLDSVVDRWSAGSSEDFALDGVNFTLSGSGMLRLEDFPTPRSERQRLWAVNDAKKDRVRQRYENNPEVLEVIFDMLDRESRKVRPRSPVGVVFLPGPTGTGKTFLGECISEAFGKGKAVKIECSQCPDQASVAPFLFSSPGSANGGALTTPVMMRKDCVVIFDEVDRAHISFLETIMNVLDAGNAVDRGTMIPVDFRQCLFFLTSNIAGEEIEACMRATPTATMAEKETAVRKILAATGRFAPEQLARISIVLPIVRSATGVAGEKEMRTALKNVLEEYGRDDLVLNPQVAIELTAACVTSGSTDVRSLKKLIESRVAPALIGASAAAYVVIGSEIHRAVEVGAEPTQA